MAYCTVADVLSKALIKPVQDAGWDTSSTSPDVTEFITETGSVIDSLLGKLGYALPFTTTPPVLLQMAKAYARYALLRDLFTGDAPSQAAAASIKANKDRFDALSQGLETGSVSLVDAAGAVIPRSQNEVKTADYPDDAGVPVDAYPNFPSGPYPDKFDPLEDAP